MVAGKTSAPSVPVNVVGAAVRVSRQRGSRISTTGRQGSERRRRWEGRAFPLERLLHPVRNMKGLLGEKRGQWLGQEGPSAVYPHVLFVQSQAKLSRQPILSILRRAGTNRLPARGAWRTLVQGIAAVHRYACAITNRPISAASARLCQNTKRRMAPSCPG